jgi:hypothetical protein
VRNSTKRCGRRLSESSPENMAYLMSQSRRHVESSIFHSREKATGTRWPPTGPWSLALPSRSLKSDRSNAPEPAGHPSQQQDLSSKGCKSACRTSSSPHSHSNQIVAVKEGPQRAFAKTGSACFPRRCSQAGSTASSHLDHSGAIHPALWSNSLRKEIISNCRNYPASDDCARGWALTLL